MTRKNSDHSVKMKSWSGKYLAVNILYSKAGVAQQIMVSHDRDAILVDAGDGVLRDLQSCDFKWEQLKGLVFTHGHFDHIGGLYSLLGFLRMIGREQMLKIFVPKGCDEVKCMVNCFLQKYSTTLPFHIKVTNLEPGQSADLAAMNIEAYAAVHFGSIKGAGITNQLPALCYRVTFKGEIIAISGDTGSSAPLYDLVKDVDLAIIEATFRDSNDANEEYLKKVHLSEDIARDIGKLAKEYIIVHKDRR